METPRTAYGTGVGGGGQSTSQACASEIPKCDGFQADIRPRAHVSRRARDLDPAQATGSLLAPTLAGQMNKSIRKISK